MFLSSPTTSTSASTFLVAPSRAGLTRPHASARQSTADPLRSFSLSRRVVNRNHMFDATEIFRTLSQHKKESFFKLGFYLIFFFYALYRMILALVAED
ncbi:protein cornichon, partial [Phenoliferia sp. Uapishka_3]